MQALLLVSPIMLSTLPFAYADELPTRSVRVSSAQVGAVASHNFRFIIPTTAAIGSLSFEYCTNSPFVGTPCVAPVGLDLSSVALVAQTGNVGFNISAPDSSANRIVLTRPAAPGNAIVSTYNFNNIINPTTANETTYVRIATYPTLDGTGSFSDNGSVAFATTTGLQVSAFVPPFLTFCVGVYVTLNCNSVTGDKVNIGELDTGQTATANLQFSGATNDGTGYTAYLNGFTMTSGNNIIPALATNSPSIPGVGQFGLNVRANSSPNVGLDPVGVGTSTPGVGYGTPNSYRFVNGEAITSSPIATDFRLFTATYIVNVSDSQPPGIYATTMTFTAVASF